MFLDVYFHLQLEGSISFSRIHFIFCYLSGQGAARLHLVRHVPDSRGQGLRRPCQEGGRRQPHLRPGQPQHHQRHRVRPGLVQLQSTLPQSGARETGKSSKLRPN